MNPGLDDNEYGDDDDDEGQIMKRGPDDREKKMGYFYTIP